MIISRFVLSTLGKLRLKLEPPIEEQLELITKAAHQGTAFVSQNQAA
jgi:hypothetical protein